VYRPWSGKSLGMMECSPGSKMSSGRWATRGRLDVAEASGWTLRVVDVLRNPQ